MPSNSLNINLHLLKRTLTINDSISIHDAVQSSEKYVIIIKNLIYFNLEKKKISSHM